MRRLPGAVEGLVAKSAAGGAGFDDRCRVPASLSERLQPRCSFRDNPIRLNYFGNVTTSIAPEGAPTKSARRARSAAGGGRRGFRLPLSRYRSVVGSGFSRDAFLRQTERHQLLGNVTKSIAPEGAPTTSARRARSAAGGAGPLPSSRSRFVVGSGFSRDASMRQIARHQLFGNVTKSIAPEGAPTTSARRARDEREARQAARSSIAVLAFPLRCRSGFSRDASLRQTARHQLRGNVPKSIGVPKASTPRTRAN